MKSEIGSLKDLGDSELKWSKVALLRWRTKGPKPKYVSLCPIPLLFGNFLKQHAQVIYGLTNLSFLKQATVSQATGFVFKATVYCVHRKCTVYTNGSSTTIPHFVTKQKSPQKRNSPRAQKAVQNFGTKLGTAQPIKLDTMQLEAEEIANFFRRGLKKKSQ